MLTSYYGQTINLVLDEQTVILTQHLLFSPILSSHSLWPQLCNKTASFTSLAQAALCVLTAVDHSQHDIYPMLIVECITMFVFQLQNFQIKHNIWRKKEMHASFNTISINNSNLYNSFNNSCMKGLVWNNILYLRPIHVLSYKFISSTHIVQWLSNKYVTK